MCTNHDEELECKAQKEIRERGQREANRIIGWPISRLHLARKEMVGKGKFFVGPCTAPVEQELHSPDKVQNSTSSCELLGKEDVCLLKIAF